MMGLVRSVVWSVCALSGAAQVVQFTPTSCLGPDDAAAVGTADELLQFTTAYAQYDVGQSYAGERGGGVNLSSVPALYSTNSSTLTGTGDVLRIVLTGTTNSASEGYSNVTTFLSTISQNTQFLTFPLSENQSALCNAIRTEGITSQEPGTGCPYGPGNIAMGVQIPLYNSYQLTTISTQLVVLDSSVPALKLACYDLNLTPYYPAYFAYALVRWLVVAVVALYFVLYLVARIWAAYTNWKHDNETFLATSLTLKLSTAETSLSRRQRWGSIWFSAWAGRQLVASGSLRRFTTADFREVFTTISWFTLVGAVAVEWPGFAYPIFTLTAWTTLIYSNSLPFTGKPDPLLPSATIPSAFASEIANTNSPLYLNTSLPSVLLDLGDDNKPGIEQWAAAAGVRHEDLFSLCAFTFLALCAAAIAAHLVFFLIAFVLNLASPSDGSRARKRATVMEANKRLSQLPRGDRGEQAYASLSGGKEEGAEERHSSLSGDRHEFNFESEDPYAAEAALDWTKARPEDDFPSWRLHLAWVQGNLTRLVQLFHLPLCVFSVYQFTLFSTAPTSTFALAVVMFVVVCLAGPAAVLWQIYRAPVRELYTSLPLLLSIGPMYTIYSDECSLFGGARLVGNVVVGIMIGAVQGTGTAQAAVIVLVEVIDTLVTSLWLPWGDNAAMGPLAFLLSIARIVIAVLLVVLSPNVGVSYSATGWLAYVVFLIEALVLLLFVVCVVFKLAELLVRLLGRVPFDESRSPRAGGLFGALGRTDRRTPRHKRRKTGGRAHQNSPAAQARKRRLAELKRREREQDQDHDHVRTMSDTTLGSQSRMLPNGARAGQTDSFADSSVYSGVKTGHEDDFIMSPMHNGTWSSSGRNGTGPGFVKAGHYAAEGAHPVLRSGPSWGSQPTIVAAAPEPGMPSAVPSGSSGFARVGGGRATSGNPYAVVKPAAGERAQGTYPPYASARRMSQSAVIEVAGAAGVAGAGVGAGEHQAADLGRSNGANSKARPPVLNLPSSSLLLSNQVSRYSSQPSPGGAAGAAQDEPAQAGGFFGRFRRKQPARQDTWSDEDDDSEEELEGADGRGGVGGGRLRGWLPAGLVGGKRRRESAPEVEAEVAEEETPTGETGFSVVRKPRPRPQVAVHAREQSAVVETVGGATGGEGTPAPTTPGAVDRDPLLGRGVPYVSVEAPSRPGTPLT